jgi:hypothetical protein
MTIWLNMRQPLKFPPQRSISTKTPHHLSPKLFFGTMVPVPAFFDDANDTWKAIKGHMDKFSGFVTRWYGVSDGIIGSRQLRANKKYLKEKAQKKAMEIRLAELRNRTAAAKGKVERRDVIWDDEYVREMEGLD